jgi:hypothetical protein
MSRTFTIASVKASWPMKKKKHSSPANGDTLADLVTPLHFPSVAVLGRERGFTHCGPGTATCSGTLDIVQTNCMSRFSYHRTAVTVIAYRPHPNRANDRRFSHITHKWQKYPPYSIATWQMRRSDPGEPAGSISGNEVTVPLFW